MLRAERVTRIRSTWRILFGDTITRIIVGLAPFGLRGNLCASLLLATRKNTCMVIAVRVCSIGKWQTARALQIYYRSYELMNILSIRDRDQEYCLIILHYLAHVLGDGRVPSPDLLSYDYLTLLTTFWLPMLVKNVAKRGMVRDVVSWR